VLRVSTRTLSLQHRFMLQYYSGFFPKMFEMTIEKVFHADDKYVLKLLNVVIHEHQFKRKGKYYKFHFDKEARLR
jgi:hypothetical protein